MKSYTAKKLSNDPRPDSKNRFRYAGVQKTDEDLLNMLAH